MSTLVERFQTAVAAQDHDALNAIRGEAPSAPDRELAKAAFDATREIPKELVALRLVVFDIAMSATGATKLAFNNALHFLGTNPTDPLITHELMRAWLGRGVPHA